ncbi:MAG: nitrogenase component 1 [Lachnospirales bacterium]
MKGINQLSSAAYPGNHCPMHTSVAIASKIQGVSTLVIGATECGYYSRNIANSGEFSNDALHWTYILDENEVVFGCRKGIVDSVIEMDKSGAKVILLISTCVPEVIGEDLEGIVFEAKKKVSAKVLYVELGNFKCGSHIPGFWQTLLAFGTLAPKCEKNKNVINVLGRSADEDHIPKPKIIEVLEESYEIKYLAPNSSIEDFEDSTKACVNLVFSPYLNPLAEYLEENHNIPFFAFHNTYSVEDVVKLYKNLYKTLGIELETRLFENYEKAKATQKKISEYVNGLTYIGSKIGAVQPLPFHRYLCTLGLKPIMIHVEDFYPSDTLWREKFLETGIDPMLCMMVNEDVDREYILSQAPELVIGDWLGRIDYKNSTIQVMDTYGRSGFELTLLILEKFENIRERI